MKYLITIIYTVGLAGALFSSPSGRLGGASAIANQCPLEGGYAVYQARNLLMTITDYVIEFEDNCIDMSKRSINTNAEGETNCFKLYPNPNNGSMILEYSINLTDVAIIRFFDITGKLVASQQLSSNESKLLVNYKLNSGTYFYDIQVNDKILKHDKLVIIK